MKKFITSKEVAKILGVSIMTVNRRARAGKIPAIKANLDGRRVHYLFDESIITALAN